MDFLEFAINRESQSALKLIVSRNLRRNDNRWLCCEDFI